MTPFVVGNVILGNETIWLDKSVMHVFANVPRKLKVSLKLHYFYCTFRGNSVFHAISCLLGYLP